MVLQILADARSGVHYRNAVRLQKAGGPMPDSCSNCGTAGARREQHFACREPSPESRHPDGTRRTGRAAPASVTAT